MANYTYDSLSNDNVRFLQGTQANLNLMLPSSTDNTKRGTAIEGAFYLTTDTHKLYVGRKVNDSTSADNNKVFPEIISAGISMVADTPALAAAAATANDGDIYYVTTGNILAIYEKSDIEGPNTATNTYGKWVQINASTAIDSFNATTSVTGGVATVKHEIITKDNHDGYNTSFTIKGSSASAGKGAVTISKDGNDLKIEADDTTYTIGANGNNQIGLKKNGGSSLETNVVTIVGAETVGVSSNASTNTITVTGPTFQAPTAAAAANNGNGFVFATNYTPGDGSGATSSASTSLDPTITVGHAVSGSNAANATVHFVNNNATLDVYTAAQTDALINNSINGVLRAADAMKYCGTVSGTSGTSGADPDHLVPTDLDNPAPAIGDTYKATAKFILDGKDVYPGDLIVANRDPDNNNALYWEVIPSGNEPWAMPSITENSASVSNGAVGLIDKNNGDANILNIQFTKTEPNIEVNVTKRNNSDDNALVTISHTGPGTTSVSRGNKDSNVGTLNNAGSNETDTIQNSAKKFYVLPNGAADITTDANGHVIGVTTTPIVFEHTAIDSVTYTETINTTNNTATLNLAVTDSYSGTANDSTVFTSETLKFTTPQANSGADIKIDLVWGSF